MQLNLSVSVLVCFTLLDGSLLEVLKLKLLGCDIGTDEDGRDGGGGSGGGGGGGGVGGVLAVVLLL